MIGSIREKVREVGRDVLLSLILSDASYAFLPIYLLYLSFGFIYLSFNGWALVKLSNMFNQNLDSGISRYAPLFLSYKALVYLLFIVPIGFPFLIYLPLTHVLGSRARELYDPLRDSLRRRRQPSSYLNLYIISLIFSIATLTLLIVILAHLILQNSSFELSDLTGVGPVLEFYVLSPLPLALSFKAMGLLQRIPLLFPAWSPDFLVLRTSLLTSEIRENLNLFESSSGGVRGPFQGFHRLRVLMRRVNEDLITLLRWSSLIALNPFQAKSLTRSDSVIDDIFSNGLVSTWLLVRELENSLTRWMRGSLSAWGLLTNGYTKILLEHVSRSRGAWRSWVKVVVSASGLTGIFAVNLSGITPITLKIAGDVIREILKERIFVQLLILALAIAPILLYFVLQKRFEAYETGVGMTNTDMLVLASFYSITIITLLEASVGREFAFLCSVISSMLGWKYLVSRQADLGRVVGVLIVILLLTIILYFAASKLPLGFYYFLIPWSIAVLILAFLGAMGDPRDRGTR